MSELGKELRKSIVHAEQKKVNERYRLKYHLMPPVGWLNDPNGLCQFKGEYHVFFQYTPFNPLGGLKVWGHYVSKDLINWEYLGTPVLPDQAWDCHGAYSGATLIDANQMVIYYTGNVKFPGEYDYIHNGRGSNTIMMTSVDGRTFSKKQCVLENKDYPDTYTNHIRDPQVIKHGENYLMFLGGRRNDDHGAVLVYESKDKVNWTYCNEITTKETFGYMWECPNVVEFGGEWFLSISPQGLTRESYKYQNVYQAGYFKGSGKFDGEYGLGEFYEWDMGFDFYAPQIFKDETGRMLLIGWAGLPDIEDEYRNASVEDGWQHALTVPRVLSLKEDKIYQYPVEELKRLRKNQMTLADGEVVEVSGGAFDLEVTKIQDATVRINISDDLVFSYEDGIASLSFRGDMGEGRTKRQAKIPKFHSVRMLCDVSLLEVYINDGEYVFTTRFYKKTEGLQVVVDCKEAVRTLWTMEAEKE